MTAFIGFFSAILGALAGAIELSTSAGHAPWATTVAFQLLSIIYAGERLGLLRFMGFRYATLVGVYLKTARQILEALQCDFQLRLAL